jgi:hypothetical protein
LAACAADRDGFALDRVRDGDGDGDGDLAGEAEDDADGAADDVFAAGVVGGWVTGAGALPVPYMEVPVVCTDPGLSLMPDTVVVLPWVSVSRTVNGPEPAPPCAIQ